jgi:uncharacterized protein DUF1707
MATTRPDLRVGDTERESTATSLREHYAQGRLSTDELDERLDAALSATTQGQLEQVTHDLPPIQPAPSATPPPPAVTVSGRRADRDAARAVTGLVSLVVLLVVVAVALHGGHHVPRNILTLVIALLILRGLVFRVFGHHHHQHRPHQHRPHQHWDHHEAQYGSHDDGDDDRFERSSRPGHEHHHERHHSRSGRGYSYSYRYEYNHEYPGESR